MSDSVRPHTQQPTRLRHPWDSLGKNTGVGCHFLLQCMKGKSESEVAQSCPTLSNSMDCSPPGSSVHGIFQARILEWVAIAFFIISLDISKSFIRKSYESCIAAKCFTVWAKEAPVREYYDQSTEIHLTNEMKYTWQTRWNTPNPLKAQATTTQYFK